MALTGGACGEGRTAPEAVQPEAGAPLGSKTADPVLQTVAQVTAARARGGSAGLAGLSTALVHVRADGAVEVVVHSATPVGPTELDQLRRLGAEVVTTTPTPPVPGQAAGAQVQMWAPAEQLATIDALPWIAAVTPPSYGNAGG